MVLFLPASRRADSERKVEEDGVLHGTSTAVTRRIWGDEGVFL